MGGNDGGGDGKEGDFLGLKMQRFLKTLLNVWIKMTFCLGIRSGWRISKRWSRWQLIHYIRIVRSIGQCCVLTSSCCCCWSLTMGGPTLASTTCYVCLLIHTQRVTRCPPISIERTGRFGQWRWSLKSSIHVITTVSCIRASTRSCRAVRTTAQVVTRGTPVVSRTWMTKDARQGRRRRQPNRSRFLRMRMKRATCRGKVLHCQCGTSRNRSPACAIREPRGCQADVMACIGRTHQGRSKLWHPSDGKQWKSFNAKFPKEFGDEARNVRFALSADGMNPPATTTLSRSPSPSTTYLPIYVRSVGIFYSPWLFFCPKQPDNDIDVFREGHFSLHQMPFKLTREGHFSPSW